MLRIAIIGDYQPSVRSHQATEEAILHASKSLSLSTQIEWVASVEGARVGEFHAIWIAPGPPHASLEGTLSAIRIARENALPLLGTCGGFQLLLLEYVRHVLGIADAAHGEYEPTAKKQLIVPMECSLKGTQGIVFLSPQSQVSQIYGRGEVEEQYLCRYGLSEWGKRLFDESGLQFTGFDVHGEPRVVELPGHPFFIGTLYAPQLQSHVGRPHPLIVEWLRLS